MVNTLRLKALLLENNFTTKKIADKLKMSQQSFSMKLNNKREFKASELFNLCFILKIFNADDIINIFFANCVEYNSTNI